MKPEILDSLLLDRAMNELSPAVMALLDAYLAQNPGAAARGAELAATVALARSATAVPHVMPRPVDFARLQREQNVLRFPSRRSEVLRLAACIALGLGVGWLLRTPRQAASPMLPGPMTAVSVPVPSTPPTTNFWSLSHFAPELTNSQSEKRL